MGRQFKEKARIQKGMEVKGFELGQFRWRDINIKRKERT